MARYRGPLAKIARRFGEDIFGSFGKELKKRKRLVKPNSKRRPKNSDYKIQLMEKQKAKYTYGLLERQFKNTFKKASAKKGITGTILLQMLESRLDNTVYRLGLAPTRRSARQFVSHRHVTVNGKVINIPSYILKQGDIVGFTSKALKNDKLQELSNSSNRTRYNWLEWDGDQKRGKYLRVPEREDIPEKISESLIVELYSK